MVNAPTKIVLNQAPSESPSRTDTSTRMKRLHRRPIMGATIPAQHRHALLPNAAPLNKHVARLVAFGLARIKPIH